MKPLEDAHGQVVHDIYHGMDAVEIVERDDGWIGPSPGPSLYFSPFRAWPVHERKAMRYVHGRVLDVGCGAGRAALELQHRGNDVVGIDVSPLAIKTARLRGVRDARLLSVTRVGTQLGQFDTILMFGNNFGLMENRRRARWLLRRFAGVTSGDGRLVASLVDPYDTTDRDHRRYHRRNWRRGRMGGQIRIRVRYGKYATPWFDWLFVSRAEMRRLVAGTGWRVERFVEPSGPAYAVVLRKL